MAAGFLSRNYILNSGSVRYFLKQYETHEPSQVASIHNENYQGAHVYLAVYHRRYPLRQEELMAAYHIHYLRAVHSLWVETEHYINGRSRVDVFLFPGLERLQFYAAHLDTHIDRISAGTLG